MKAEAIFKVVAEWRPNRASDGFWAGKSATRQDPDVEEHAPKQGLLICENASEKLFQNVSGYGFGRQGEKQNRPDHGTGIPHLLLLK